MNMFLILISHIYNKTTNMGCRIFKNNNPATNVTKKNKRGQTFLFQGGMRHMGSVQILPGVYTDLIWYFILLI